MSLLLDTQVTLLLTSYVTRTNSNNAKPLTNIEWNNFAFFLKDKNITPASLLDSDPISLLNGWHDKKIDVERIVQLLDRRNSLALAIEKWGRAGLWVITLLDEEYPKRLKDCLKWNSPPVLYGYGNKTLLNEGGLAIVGSREAVASDLSFTRQIGAKAASEGILIVSGGARGVDETAMLGAMENGGTVIGVMADSLLKAATSAKWRSGIKFNKVVLVSTSYPEAKFTVGNAMGRNKYIYCLADSALVIHAGKGGGTVSGAKENLKNHWVSLWVKPTDDKNAANADLIEKGGRWCDPEIENIKVSELVNSENAKQESQQEIPLLKNQ